MGRVTVQRSKWERRRRVIAMVLSAACAAVLIGVCVIVYGFVSGASAEEIQRALAIAAPSAAIVGALVGIAAKVPALLRQLFERQDHTGLVHPRLIPNDHLVDRTKEIGEMTASLADSGVINCWGAKGAGKSFLLKHFSDVVNGYRHSNPDHPSATGIDAAIYFDLAEAVGAASFERDLPRQIMKKEHATWDDFIRHVAKRFPRKRVLLILDNANAPALWPAVGGAAYSYRAGRPEDLLIFGSVQKITLNNFAPSRVRISGLDPVYTGDLIASKGVELSPERVESLHRQFNGLPYYTGLFAVYGGGAPDSADAVELETALDTNLIPTLAEPTRSLLAYGALLALVSRQISIRDLEHCSLPNLDLQLQADEGLLTPLAGSGRVFGMHDVLRDSVLRVVKPEVEDAATHLFEVARSEGRLVDAAIFAMFADPYEVGANAFDAVLGQVIRGAVESRDYAVLESLHSRSWESTRMRKFLAADQERHELFCWGRATQLAGLGQYGEAEDELLSSGVADRARSSSTETSSDLAPQIRFLLADIAHLQNRYDDAAQMFLELGDWATSAAVRDPKLHARCTWGRAHVLRHQGKDLDSALDLFEEAARLGRRAGELFSQSYSITGETGIRVYLEELTDDEEQRLVDIEADVIASGRKGYLLEIWKSQAQVAWLRGNPERTFEIIDAAIGSALKHNDRLLFNLYFEKGEFLRLSGRPEEGLAHHLDVLRFGEKNGDRNLISTALLGIVLAEMTEGKWRYHHTQEQAFAACLRAQQLAADADIQITRQIAERLAAAVAGNGSFALEQQRLIQF
jgi:tetratricopeptide (TPR) repeat protein